MLLDKIKKFLRSIKTPQEKKPEWIGLGLAWLWGLREDHPLTLSASHHDAGQDSIEVFLGNKKISDCPEKPIYYRELVEVKLNELKAIIRANPNLSIHECMRIFIFREDNSFLRLCTKFAKGDNFYIYQGRFFYFLVKTYSKIKYRNKIWKK